MKNKQTLLQELWALREIYFDPEGSLVVKDFMLDADENTKKYHEYNNELGEMIKIISPSIVVKQYKDIILCLDSSRQKILFYAEFYINNDANYIKIHDNNKTSSIKFGTYIEIQSIYRDPKYPETLGLPEFLYLKYFMVKYQTVFSNHTQSNLGRKFWTSLIKKSFGKRLNVYVFNLAHGFGNFEYEQYDAVKFTNYREFLEFSNHSMIWNGSSSDYTSVRLAISKKNVL